MKLKFILVSSMLFGFAVVSYADCSKNEILKLVDKGFSKTEINEICKKSESKKEELTWVTPTNKICRANGGRITKGVCEASWKEAKKICSASNGRLATVDELEERVNYCEINGADWQKYRGSEPYKKCFKSIGFSWSKGYWSSSTTKYEVWVVPFSYGRAYTTWKKQEHYVKCVK